MKNWVKIDSSEFNSCREESFRGAKIRVFLAPHDIPTGVSGGIDEQNDKFVINFSYLEEEPYIEEQQDQGVVLRLGKYSKRLLAIAIETSHLKDKVQLELLVPQVATEAIDKFIQNSAKQPDTRRYEVAKDIIDRNRVGLFSSVD